jgi:hypothetical protein
MTKEDVSVLRALRGKQLVIVEQHLMLTSACRSLMVGAGAIVGPAVRSTGEVLDVLMEGGVDAVIVDIEIDNETLLSLAAILEEAAVPFIFASRARSDRGGYCMNGDVGELRKAADALFGVPGISTTLH